MPGVTARSASKNMSKSKRASLAKNSRRVEAVLNDELESCTYGKISKALGNKMFLVINANKKEHLAHIRGKMARINAGDVVLLNIRDYESRVGSNSEVYDIMAVFNTKDISKLIKAGTMPSWMSARVADVSSDDDMGDIFDYDEESDEEDDDNVAKKDKKSHRVAKAITEEDDDSDVDIDNI